MVEVTSGLSRIQRMQLLIAGSAPTGMRRRPGWRCEIQFYVFRCPVHGIVENYPQATAGLSGARGAQTRMQI